MTLVALGELAADMGHPRVQVSEHLTIEGAEAWRRVLDHFPPTTPPEARRLLRLLLEHDGLAVEAGEPAPWLCPELVATAGGRDRFRAWCAVGRPTPDTYALVKGIRYLGDGEVRAIVMDVLQGVPPPTAWSALTEGWTFQGVGWSTAGWMIRVAAPPAGPVQTFVYISGASRSVAYVHDVALHEIAHAFLISTPQRPVAAEALENERQFLVLKAAMNPELLDELLDEQRRAERSADALARAWGGRLTCSDERANDYTRREAACLAAVYLP